MPPATDASKRTSSPLDRARSRSSVPWYAISCLLAVTTDLPELRAVRTQSYVGRRPPTSSMTMSTSAARTSSIDSVQTTDEGTQSTRFLATFRLKMCVRRTCGSSPLHRILATDCPTVPNPSSATRDTAVAFDVT